MCKKPKNKFLFYYSSESHLENNYRKDIQLSVFWERKKSQFYAIFGFNKITKSAIITRPFNI